MDLKLVAKRWVPPILVDWYRSIKHGRLPRRFYWEGIYRNFQDLPVKGMGYSADLLTQESLSYTRKTLEDSKILDSLPADTTGERFFLPLLVAMMSHSYDQVSILDFGGGLGIDYIHMKKAVLAEKLDIQYHIVENPSVCKAGSLLFENDSHIHFYVSLPTDLMKVHIVYICSTLQYIADYTSLLKQLSQYEPEYFLFVKLSAGTIPTYATSQKNLGDNGIPYWFINLREIETIMLDNGYSLTYKTTLEREYDQSNFPEEYRLGRTCNLLFRRMNPDE